MPTRSTTALRELEEECGIRLARETARAALPLALARRRVRPLSRGGALSVRRLRRVRRHPGRPRGRRGSMGSARHAARSRPARFAHGAGPSLVDALPHRSPRSRPAVGIHLSSDRGLAGTDTPRRPFAGRRVRSRVGDPRFSARVRTRSQTGLGTARGAGRPRTRPRCVRRRSPDRFRTTGCSSSARRRVWPRPGSTPSRYGPISSALPGSAMRST